MPANTTHPTSRYPSTMMEDMFKEVIKRREAYLSLAAEFISLHPEVVEIVRDGKAFKSRERRHYMGKGD